MKRKTEQHQELCCQQSSEVKTRSTQRPETGITGAQSSETGLLTMPSPEMRKMSKWSMFSKSKTNETNSKKPYFNTCHFHR